MGICIPLDSASHGPGSVFTFRPYYRNIGWVGGFLDLLVHGSFHFGGWADLGVSATAVFIEQMKAMCRDGRGTAKLEINDPSALMTFSVLREGEGSVGVHGVWRFTETLPENLEVEEDLFHCAGLVVGFRGLLTDLSRLPGIVEAFERMLSKTPTSTE